MERASPHVLFGYKEEEGVVAGIAYSKSWIEWDILRKVSIPTQSGKLLEFLKKKIKGIAKKQNSVLH